MSVQMIRPDVSELVLRTYSRALHPELFEHHCCLTITNANARLDIRLNASGHVLMLHMGSSSLTEVIVDHREQLPTPDALSTIDCAAAGRSLPRLQRVSNTT